MISTSRSYLRNFFLLFSKKFLIHPNSNQSIHNIPLNTYNFSSQKNFPRDSSQSLLKQYFGSRLSLSASQLQSFLVDLSKTGDVKLKDHRWENLSMTIEKLLVEALGRMKQNNSLYLTLYKNVVAEFHHLTLDQMALLIWSMTKVKHNDKAVLMAVYKKLHQVTQDNQKIFLHKEHETLSTNDSLNFINDHIKQKTHHMYEGSFVQLVWALQRTKIIDNKLMLDLLKYVLHDKDVKNIEKIRIENLSLLAYCIEELQFEKYRISQSIINQIMKSWKELQSLSILSLVLLNESFCKFVDYQQSYLKKYEDSFTPEQMTKKRDYLQKERKFIYLIAETILLRQDQHVKPRKGSKNKNNTDDINNDDKQQLSRLINPLSGKFASLILFHLAKINLYDRKIWFKLLTSITDDVDHAQIIDLSMALSAICNLNKEQIPNEDMKSIIYYHKKIMCRRIFQIYSSLSGKSLNNIKKLVFDKKIENQMVPSTIRKEIEKELMSERARQEREAYKRSMREIDEKEPEENQEQKQFKEQKNPRGTYKASERKQGPQRTKRSLKNQATE